MILVAGGANWEVERVNWEAGGVNCEVGEAELGSRRGEL